MVSIGHIEPAEKHCLSLVGELSIHRVAAVRQELLQALESRQQLEVVLAGSEDFDTTGVQLLRVLEGEAVRQNSLIGFVEHSAVVRGVLELHNLVDELGELWPYISNQGGCSQ